MKRNKFIVFIILLGLGIMAYPFIGSWYNNHHFVTVGNTYTSKVANLSPAEIEEQWAKAYDYNNSLRGDPVKDPFIPGSGRALPGNYLDVLDVNHVIGKIQIPTIKVDLPIYHGTSDKVLKKGVGHIEGTTFPLGDNGHSILTGHTGLPSAKIFDELVNLEEGDEFFITVLDKTFIYTVDNIKVILPEEFSSYDIKGGYFVTLVTCTPYGINSHRLLVRGKFDRIASEGDEQVKAKKVIPMKRILALFVIAAGLLLLILPTCFRQHFRFQTKRLETAFSKQQDKRDTDTLYDYLQAENQRLYEDKQKGLKDPFSYQVPAIDLRTFGIEDNLFGFITIPKLDETLPLYLGASEENLKKGATHLTQTSYPIGGLNTNAVIAAHRGYYKAKMFRHIDKLTIGDTIYIKNFKETLTYQVSEVKIIDPSDIKEILIREGKDMVTLISCHPYPSNRQRYVVYCERT